MNLITLEQVSKQFSERLLLDEVDLLINQGDRIGLIGINGSGKTTLLHIIAGLESQDKGQVIRWGHVRVQYLPQEPQLDENLTVLTQVFSGDVPQIRLLRDFEWVSQQLQHQPDDQQLQDRLMALNNELERTNGWAAEARVKAILTRLGILDFSALISTLSGGERKRVALAQVLIDEPDLLILDEPTNHIDADTVAWLETYLTTFKGALLMVTHDRYFLERVANRIVELNRRKLVSYVGGYGRFLELRTAREERLANADQKHQRLLQRELAWLRRGAMARSTKQKARKQRIGDLQRIKYDRNDERVIFALAGRRLGKQVLKAENLSKQFDGRTLFSDLNFSLAPGDRIGIIGPNGAGKSTLLDILTGLQEADSGVVRWGETVHLGYYDQHNRGLIEEMKVIDFINKEAPLVQTPDGTRVEAAQMLEWFMFPRPQQQAQIRSLSGGERRRLYLLTVLVHRPNVLILDEPTNDLDIQTLTVLESFLDAFQGCLLLVSHDRYFLDRTVDFLATFDNGRFSARYPTPYETYQRLQQEQWQKEQAEAQRPLPSPTAPTIKTKTQPARPRKLSWKEKQELESLNQRIDELETKQTTLHEAINSNGRDYTRLTELSIQLETTETELESLMERWLTLSEIAEDR